MSQYPQRDLQENRMLLRKFRQNQNLPRRFRYPDHHQGLQLNLLQRNNKPQESNLYLNLQQNLNQAQLNQFKKMWFLSKRPLLKLKLILHNKSDRFPRANYRTWKKKRNLLSIFNKFNNLLRSQEVELQQRNQYQNNLLKRQQSKSQLNPNPNQLHLWSLKEVPASHLLRNLTKLLNKHIT